MQSSPSLITRGSHPWPSLTSGSAGLVRLHVTDGRKCATDHPAARLASAAHLRRTGDGGGFSRSTMRHRDSLGERRRPSTTDPAGHRADSAYAEYDGNRVAI